MGIQFYYEHLSLKRPPDPYTKEGQEDYEGPNQGAQGTGRRLRFRGADAQFRQRKLREPRFDEELNFDDER